MDQKHVKLLLSGIGEWNKNRPDKPDLIGADLQHANLLDANLQHANLFGANLQRANLFDANLRHANLQHADLQDTNLQHTDLLGANLFGANLFDVNLNWRSHDLLSEILRQNANCEINKLLIAGLPLVTKNQCWAFYCKNITDTEIIKWFIKTLKPFAQKNMNNVPKEIKHLFEKEEP